MAIDKLPSDNAQPISRFDRLNTLRQETRTIQIRNQLAEHRFLTIPHIAEEALKNSENFDPNLRQSSKKLRLEEKLKKLREETKEIKARASQADQTHEKFILVTDEAMEIARKAINQADHEIQIAKNIREEQENIKQQMVVIHHNLNKIDTQTLILEEEQTVLFQDLKDIEESLDTSLTDLYSDKLNEKIQDIRIKQEKLEDQIDILFEKNTHPQINENEINDNPTTQDCLKKNWQHIKNYGHSVVNHTWENVSYAESKITSIVKDVIFNQIVSMFKQAIKSIINRIWTFIKNCMDTTTWVALGVFATCFTVLALKKYPMTSLLIGGCLFIVIKITVIPVMNFLKV